MLLVLTLALTAQTSTTSITGSVIDETGAGRPGVTITITSPAMIGERTTVTDETGAFRFTNLPPGRYQLRADLPAFASTTRTVEARLGQAASLLIAFLGTSTMPNDPPFTIVRVDYGTNRTRHQPAHRV